jgi:hypothetical protein
MSLWHSKRPYRLDVYDEEFVNDDDSEEANEGNGDSDVADTQSAGGGCGGGGCGGGAVAVEGGRVGRGGGTK